jgi:hypothetical protein
LHLNQIVVHHRIFNFGNWRFFSLILELANELLEIGQPLEYDNQQPESVVPNQVPNADTNNNKKIYLIRLRNYKSRCNVSSANRIFLKFPKKEAGSPFLLTVK